MNLFLFVYEVRKCKHRKGSTLNEYKENIYLYPLFFCQATYFPVFYLSSSFEGQTPIEQRPQGFRGGKDVLEKKNEDNLTETANENENTFL